MLLTGEVSAVEASIEKAKQFVAEKGMYLDSSVIAHPDKRMMDSLFIKCSQKGGKADAGIRKTELNSGETSGRKKVVVSELSQLYEVSEETIQAEILTSSKKKDLRSRVMAEQS